MLDYEIQGNYKFGWEMVTTETNFIEAKKRLREYRDNEPNISFRIKRIKSED
jgi:hypothetical protein